MKLNKVNCQQMAFWKNKYYYLFSTIPVPVAKKCQPKWKMRYLISTQMYYLIWGGSVVTRPLYIDFIE